jgi:hypothetical protein
MGKSKITKIEKLTLEEYILKMINQHTSQLHTLNEEKEDYSEKDYQFLWISHVSAINILYQCLTSQK